MSLAWHVVLVAAAYGLLPLTPSWSPDLGATVVSLVAALVPVAVVLRRGWTTRPWLRLRRPRRPLLLVPVLAVALSYGVPGIAGTPGVLLSSAALFLAVGVSEELLSRGRWCPRPPSARGSPRCACTPGCCGRWCSCTGWTTGCR